MMPWIRGTIVVTFYLPSDFLYETDSSSVFKVLVNGYLQLHIA